MPAVNAASAVTKRVLVVDDNRPSAMTLTWAMEIYGYEVRTCFDGASAIAMAEDFHPEIVLLDLGMPAMDGFEVCRRLRQDLSMSDATVVAQTGWGDAQMRKRTREAGFDYHVTKPVNLDALTAFLSADRARH